MADDVNIMPNTDEFREKKPKKSEPPARVNKRSSFSKFLSSFGLKNTKGFLYHVVYHILEPSAINAVDDMLKDGIDAILHKDDPRYRRRDDRRRNPGGVSYVDYNSMSESRSNSAPYERGRSADSPEPRDIVFRDRYTADCVLEDMRDYIDETNFCSIGDFYDIVKKETNGEINITPGFTSEKYGWFDLDGVRPEGTYDGRYRLRLPRTEHR